MNRGRRGEEVFEGKKDYNTFIDLLKDLVEEYHVNIAAYCLMSNHYHLLIQTPEANISRAMRHLNGVYTQRYNRFHYCDGQLFRGRYKCILVDADSYLLELVRYIHRNPIEAGMVKNLDQYTWSSHNAFLSSAKKWDWLHKDYILSLFSKIKAESVLRYKHFVSKEILEEINQIFARKNLPTVIGQKSFVDKIKEKFFGNKIHEEIPSSKSLAPDVDRIVGEVCKFYNVNSKDLQLSRRGHFNEPRNVAIYLIRHLRCDTLKDVGNFFGINKNSTISSVDRRLMRKMMKDKRIKKNVKTLKYELSKGQE
jgi:REP element-mobilizing transposase RayT